MSGDSSAVPTSKKSLHCYHCNQDGFKRSELTDKTYPAGAFLCVDCRAIPGAQGQLLSKYAGLRSGSPDYWNRTKDQLNLVGSPDNAKPVNSAPQPLNIITGSVAPASAVNNAPVSSPSVASVAPSEKPKQRSTRTELQKWRLSVYASSLAADVKLCLLCLAEWGDYETGANIFPSEQAIADALGLTRWQVRRLLRLGRDWAVPLRTKRQKGSRGDSVNLYQLRRPADAKYGPWNGPSRCDPTWIAVKGIPEAPE